MNSSSGHEGPTVTWGGGDRSPARSKFPFEPIRENIAARGSHSVLRTIPLRLQEMVVVSTPFRVPRTSMASECSCTPQQVVRGHQACGTNQVKVLLRSKRQMSTTNKGGKKDVEILGRGCSYGMCTCFRHMSCANGR